MATGTPRRGRPHHAGRRVGRRSARLTSARSSPHRPSAMSTAIETIPSLAWSSHQSRRASPTAARIASSMARIRASSAATCFRISVFPMRSRSFWASPRSPSSAACSSVSRSRWEARLPARRMQWSCVRRLGAERQVEQDEGEGVERSTQEGDVSREPGRNDGRLDDDEPPTAHEPRDAIGDARADRGLLEHDPIDGVPIARRLRAGPCRVGSAHHPRSDRVHQLTWQNPSNALLSLSRG